MINSQFGVKTESTFGTPVTVDRFFQFLKARLRGRRNAAAADLDRDLRRVAVQMRDQDVADHMIEMRVLVDDAFQARRDRTDQAVGQG